VRFLGVGHYNDLGALYLRLQARGHAVRVHTADAGSADILEGLIERSPDWRDDLPWVLAGDGLVVFEDTGWGREQDRLRAEGVRVVGGSEFGDRLEDDRVLGQSVLRDAGLHVAPTVELDGFDEALAYVARHPARYVLKFSGGATDSTRSYVGGLDDGRDVAAVLQLQRRRAAGARSRVVLMQHLKGVEVGVGAFFDGKAFMVPANLDWEHKRLFPGDVGELTGEMGTVVTYRGADRLFGATLARLAPRLREARHVGYVNLNLIVNDDGAFPLELTCRFGYPGFAILEALHDEPWDVLLPRLCAGEGTELRTHGGFAVGVVLTVPPFPYPDGYERLSKGLPIVFRDDLDEADREALHYGEVRMDRAQLVTAGEIGYVMVVTGRGDTVEEARAVAYGRAAKVVIPNVRYRVDIGATFERQRAELVRLGWLEPTP
jgi:phosphoribosylamine--glycine ligase